MAHSCPYCGAAIKLNFCVVCGRQSNSNKMGNLRSSARNTEATLHLADPLGVMDKRNPQQALRFRKGFRLFNIILGLSIIAILMFCAIKQATNFRIVSALRWPIKISLPSHSLEHHKQASKHTGTKIGTKKGHKN